MSEYLENAENELLDSAVAEGGAYEILRRRLQDLGGRLQTSADDLNARRLEEFGQSQMTVLGRVRIRTENNCAARDIIRVGDWLLFGCNVFLGLKRETSVADVFSLYRLEVEEGNYDAHEVNIAGTFLDDPSFVQDFLELFRFYKNPRLLRLAEKNGHLLAAFQIGEKLSDIRVFRWSISPDGKTVRYIDNRGERDLVLPQAHDFEWTRTTREDEVHGRHPHINVLDTVFVETVGGDLTIKRENNTEDGLGIYREDVLDANQSLADGVVEYAKVGRLILLRILPYRETDWRHFVYNTLTHDVLRIDAIGCSCIQLPEDHGIIFPGGYYLQSGEYKLFEQGANATRFRRRRNSPNGEDVLYIFFEEEKGNVTLLNYNMIRREVATPLPGKSYALFEDGRLILFENGETQPTRVHPMQIWETPFTTEEFAARTRNNSTPLGRIGNAELVRGISDLYNIAREIDSQRVSASLYEKLCQDTRKLFDVYFWLKDEVEFHFAATLREIVKTGELVLDEYEKVESIRNQSERALAEAATAQRELFTLLVPEKFHTVQDYADGLSRIALQHGKLISLRSLRYMDIGQVDEMEAALKEREERLSHATADFLAGEKALAPFGEQLDSLDAAVQKAQTASTLTEPSEALVRINSDLDTLSRLISSLTFEDTTLQTSIIENISQVFARTNQVRAHLDQRHRVLGGQESVARFGAQFRLFSQGVAGALSMATDPERCDEELSRLLLQLEELESQFGQFEQFQEDILAKREEVLETFESHKQALLDERQRRSQSLQTAAERIMSTFSRRTARFTTVEELNAFFVADPMARKVAEIAGQLRDLKDTVRADDIEARLKAAQDQARRALRDKSELFEEGGAAVRLGPRHRFSVNTQELDLTILPREDGLSLHLTGTDFHEPLENAELEELRDYWQMYLESESPEVSRAEYLAYTMVYLASQKQEDMDALLIAQTQPGGLEKVVGEFAALRYREGYEKGIHDHDAALILHALLPLGQQADLLRYSPEARALAMLFWQSAKGDALYAVWPEWAKTSQNIRKVFSHEESLESLQGEMCRAIGEFAETRGFLSARHHLVQASEFLSFVLCRAPLEFVCGKYARTLAQTLRHRMEENHVWADFAHTQKMLGDRLADRWNLAMNWLSGLVSESEYAPFAAYAPEAAALVLLEGTDAVIRYSEADLQVKVEGLMSSHPRIKPDESGKGCLDLTLNEFFSRLRRHRKVVVPGFLRYQELRQSVLDEERRALRLNEFKPRPLSSFVRNRLIDQVYLPLIGDNLAKQIGALGAGKRTDLMGLLMIISPPGYGKTTLMEYVAHCLGLIFMRINGPALGHSVISLDPAQAPDATSRLELEKLNLAFEMGNNVMLYVDDIQHCNPEFLQKFISLCDGTRRIEGVWKGRTKTYNFRGKKFCVVMAGNPYTESGEVFQIPDMLANRADIYNLGEVLGGMQDAFALSYIENSLTSNPVLARLARGDMADLYRFVDSAEGKAFSSNDLAGSYSDAEITEITGVLARILKLRDVVMLVNRQYIESASQSEKYRKEPPFKLQGSYRSMNKLAEQVSAVMNDAELERVVNDFYVGEAQLLTDAAEENLLKLAEIRGVMTDDQAGRWEEIKQQFVRNKTFGGGDADVGEKVVAQLYDLVQSVKGIRK